MATNGNIKGLDKLIKDLKAFGVAGMNRIEDTTEIVARDISLRAASNAPVDTGKLRQGIRPVKLDNLRWKVITNSNGVAPYSAYMEFGTGGLVSVPDELKDIAIKFKGKGLKQINLPARPYLYPAFVDGRIKYVKELEQDLKELTNKI